MLAELLSAGCVRCPELQAWEGQGCLAESLAAGSETAIMQLVVQS